jgi:hypothetical protein
MRPFDKLKAGFEQKPKDLGIEYPNDRCGLISDFRRFGRFWEFTVIAGKHMQIEKSAFGNFSCGAGRHSDS